MTTTISVIIPTLNAGKMIGPLIERLQSQRRVPEEIIVVDSSSDDDTREVVKRYPGVRLVVIGRSGFNHGGTRDYALRESVGDFVLFLTQDAMPATPDYISQITEPFNDSRVAMVYGRQLPRPDARKAERLIREYSYSDASMRITRADIPRLGIKAFRGTDVCAAYRRIAYLEVGGFENPVKTNEDMFITARFLHAGWTVVYEASATVVHSHNFTFKQQYERNYIQGYEIVKHADILGGASLKGEGVSLVKYTVQGLLRQGEIVELGRFLIDCGFRLIGNSSGSRQARLELKRKKREQ